MTTAGKRKANTNVQSTDRGGALLLPFGVLLLGFGFMMLMGATLITSGRSLNFFKGMAIGLGGGFFLLVPLMVIWLGILLCVSSKRYVSMYAFFISLLLVMAIGAMMTLTTSVSNSSLIDYIGNSVNPKSMGAFVVSAYRRVSGWSTSFIGMDLYPGGGVLGMLLAYPLYITLGNAGAAVLVGILIFGLIFALLRVNPASLVRIISDVLSRKPRQTAATAKAQPAGDTPVAQVYPEDEYAFDNVIPPQPLWPSPMPEPVFQTDSHEPGFVMQPASSILEEPSPVPFMPAVQQQQRPLAYQPAAKTMETSPVKTAPTPIPVKESKYVPEPHKAEEKPEMTRAEPLRAKLEETASQPKPIPAVKPEELPFGKRQALSRGGKTPIAATLDGMVKKPDAKQLMLPLDDYQTPPVRLLTEPPEEAHLDTTNEDRQRADKLIETLSSFSIPAHLHDIIHGPTVTRFAIRLAEGINVSRLRSVMDNLSIELKAKGEIRAEIPIPGTSYVGLEVSNDKPSKVYLRDVLTSVRMQESKSPTSVALGKDITGTPIVSELMDMPHLLIAGATGSGKSVCINSIICSMLYRASPRQVRMIMVDPKFVELQPYNDVPHLLMPVITDVKKAASALDWVCQKMDERYQVLVDAGVRNLDAYNRKLGPDEEPLPRIIVIVDEMADMMTVNGKLIEDHIKRITAKARAAGICLILATQRPSVNIITGVIKANIPGRIAFRVSSPFDSKTILDEQGAEKLLGYGDMLYRSMTREPIRVQGCFVSDKDVEQTVEYIRSRNKAEYDLELMEHIEKSEQAENSGGMEASEAADSEFDELLPQAIEMAVEAGQMSISMLQRVLRVGYARSGRLIDEMARRGVISGNEGTKPRRTLMSREQYMNYLEQSDKG
jgi:S-DNA-T family DNA segregation ATPase FtsK/SpoIIIE